MSYKSNIKEIVNKLDAKDKRATIAAQKGLVIGLEFFKSKIIKEQMTGRKFNLGLNVKTGNARRSWFIRTRYEANGFIATLLHSTLSDSTAYLAVHQFGATIRPKKKEWLHFKIGDNWIKTKSVRIPKRLYVIEDFKESGLKILSRKVLKSIIKEFK